MEECVLYKHHKTSRGEYEEKILYKKLATINETHPRMRGDEIVSISMSKEI